MKLKWQQRDFKPDIDFIYYHQQDDTPMWWKKMLFNAYPSLDFDYAQSLAQEKRFGTRTAKNQKRQTGRN